MPIRDIRLLGDPILRAPAREVATFDASLRDLVSDMVDTMHAAPGIGLAAPQVGVDLRVLVYDVDGVAGHLVNPQLSTSGEPSSREEGCLSVPDVYGEVTRPHAVVARGQDVTGAAVEVVAEGLLARCLQHEVDHLDGVLFFDRMEPSARRMVLKEVRGSDWVRTGTRSWRPDGTAVEA